MALVKIAVYKSNGKSVLLLQEYDKKVGCFIRQGPSNNGWWRVEWTRKPPKMHKGITGYMSREQAQVLADVLNNLSSTVSRNLITQIQSQGRNIQSNHELMNLRFVGCR